MKLNIYTFSIILIFFNVLNSSGQPAGFQHRLNDLYGRILLTSDDEEKIRLNDSIRLLIDEFTLSELVFEKKYPEIRFLGQIASPGSEIRILTWNLMLRDGSNKYFCYLIRKGKKGGSNDRYFLEGEHREEAARTDRRYQSEDWYGALYYAIQPFKKDFILLGYDFGDRDSRKIIDVLHFNSEGKLSFGDDIFIKDKNRNYREVLEYSSESVVSLRFISRNLIVFDQLALFAQGDESATDFRGAEGILFDGYVLKKGKWIFRSGIEARNPKNKRL